MSSQKENGMQSGTIQTTRGSTGPRTPRGKARSRYNAIKHGIFASVAVLNGESRAEFESLLSGLWDTFQPVGSPEGILVEKLATLIWRHRRLILAEAGEIGKNTQFIEWDQKNEQRSQAEVVVAEIETEDGRGLIRDMANPEILERCLELLTELRDGFKAEGFQLDWALETLAKIFGGSEEVPLRETLHDTYLSFQNESEMPENERLREGYASPSECRAGVLKAIDGEIHRLKDFQKARAPVEAERTRLEILRRSVPGGPGMDGLLRYEASLERHFDRTLSQLERLQRMRLGQAVPPPVKVELSRS